VDEKSQIQALDRTAPCLPMLPTTPARMTHDYVRNGTASLFAALDPASGPVIAQPWRRHRHQEFLRFLKLIDTAVPKDLDLHLVLDNYATHTTPAIHQWLLKHPRFHPGIRKWINEWNKNPKPFVWTKSADEILETLAAYCRRVSSQEC